MQLKVASYNIHKAVGLDRRRDPERILSVLREIDAGVVALQEADRRIGRRASALPLGMIQDHTHFRPVPLSMKPDSIGWHGNALLVKREIEVLSQFLPKTLGEDDVVALLAPVTQGIRAAANDGAATGVAMKHLKTTGAAVDGKVVSAAVRRIRA